MTPKLRFAIIGVVVLVLAGGLAVLATLDIPAPSETVVKTLDDDRFPT